VAEIDVTDVLLDSDVAGDVFVVLRRQETVSDLGLSTLRVSEIPGVLGSVQPTGDNSLTREEAYDAKERTLRVITQFRLRGPSQTTGAAGYKPDVIRWGGDCYEVKVVSSYALFGGGYVEAECVQIDYVGTPPHQLAPSGGRLDFTLGTNSALTHGAQGC
jgi:hypothetical protein